MLSINGEQWAGKIRLAGFVDVFFLIAYSANARFEHGIIVYSMLSSGPRWRQQANCSLEDKLAFGELTGITSKENQGKSQGDNNADGIVDHQEPEESQSLKHNTANSLCSYPADLTDLEGAGDDANTDPNAKTDQPKSPKPTDGQASQPAEQTKGTDDQADEETVAPEFRKTRTFSIKSLGHPVGLQASYPKSWIRSYKVEITKPASWGLSSEWHPRAITSL